MPHTLGEEVSSLEPVFAAARRVGKGAWIVLDIDHTLLRSSEYFGSEPWYEACIERHIQTGLPEAEAILAANADWEKVGATVRWVAVEERSPEWLRNWQASPALIMGLTCRTGVFAEPTRAQLLSVGIDLAATALKKTWSGGGAYHGGVLYMGPLGEKGPVLREFALSAEVPPSHVFFVDDRHGHVRSVRHELAQSGIPCSAVRLNVMDDSAHKLYGVPR
ncbi:DUF2608 domain-containing protein [bacterium]|nr:DUF2608 domain-containing protein [bacterium]